MNTIKYQSYEVSNIILSCGIRLISIPTRSNIIDGGNQNILVLSEQVVVLPLPDVQMSLSSVAKCQFILSPKFCIDFRLKVN